MQSIKQVQHFLTSSSQEMTRQGVKLITITLLQTHSKLLLQVGQPHHFNSVLGHDDYPLAPFSAAVVVTAGVVDVQEVVVMVQHSAENNCIIFSRIELPFCKEMLSFWRI